jgi:uncharacterized membrane protein YccC
MSAAAADTPLRRRLAEWGFQVPLFMFALRTALAAFAALAIAYALGLEHPHWAAMSVWASSQPTREHLLSRSRYRFSGSVVGVAYAVLLVLLAQDSPWVLAVGLALWGAACAFLGNLQRGYLVYGCMLAGYSAAMVVLLHHGPASTIWALGLDRVLTVITGVACALLISWWFAPRRNAVVLISQNRHALALVLRAAAAQCRGAALSPPYAAELQTQLARVEELLELYPEGSRTARRTSKSMHRQQHQALELLYHLAQVQLDAGTLPHDARRAAAPDLVTLALTLDTLCRHLQQPLTMPAHDDGAVASALDAAIAACEATMASRGAPAQPSWEWLAALQQLLEEMRRAAFAEHEELPTHAHADVRPRHADDAPRGPLVLHRDWVGARQAAIRAGGTLLLFGLVWAATGWALVGFGMLGLSVMLLVFSAFENPRRTMGFVLRGQTIGAVLALACLGLVWPLATSGWAMVWLVLPFALLAGLVYAHQRTNAGGMDVSMVMLILLPPVYPYAWDAGKSFGLALAVLSGPALAWLAYTFVYPTNAQRRMRTLAQMMLAEVPALAQRLLQEVPAAGPQAPIAATPSLGQIRLHHRMLRLMRWADRSGHASPQDLAQMGQALRFTQASMLDLNAWRQHSLLATPAERRAAREISLALRRTAQWRLLDASDAQAQAIAKAARAWQALAEQPGLPVPLAWQARRLAQHYLPVLSQARRALQTASR